MTGGWEVDLWSGECWEGVLREMDVFILPLWQWECRVAVAPLLLRWRKVSRSRESWALLSMVGWWEVTWGLLYFSHPGGFILIYVFFQ